MQLMIQFIFVFGRWQKSNRWKLKLSSCLDTIMDTLEHLSNLAEPLHWDSHVRISKSIADRLFEAYMLAYLSCSPFFFQTNSSGSRFLDEPPVWVLTITAVYV